MSEKFTPGPWEKEYSARRDEWEIYIDGDCIALASVYPNVPEYGANAALMAAAPDMYEALEKLINDLPDCTIDWARDGMGNTNANCIVNSRDNGKAALAKARGE